MCCELLELAMGAANITELCGPEFRQIGLMDKLVGSSSLGRAALNIHGRQIAESHPS